MPNPFPLRLTNAAEGTMELDLHTVLQNAWGHEELVENYEWPETRPSDCSTVGRWKTTRRQYVRALPPIFMLHLQRFGWSTGSIGSSITRLHALDDQQCWNIPETLDLKEFLVVDEGKAAAPTTTFRLRGAILHVSEPDEQIDTGDGTDGHYVALVGNNNQWVLVDDDRVEDHIPLDRALRWLGGDW